MAPGVSSCHYREAPPSISFSGSGFLATYQLGVVQCFLNYTPWILSTAPCVLGASAGSLVAAAVVCEMSPVTIRDEVLNFAKQMKDFTLGPFNPSINVSKWLESVLNKHLTSDAHQLANGRLAVAMTRLTDSKLTIISEFHSKEDVVQALLCSCFVPGYCGLLPPSFKGEHYVDGGFRSMQPTLPVPFTSTLTVSPFSGESDICPSDSPSMWDMVVSGSTLKGNMANSFRIINALYPMALETLSEAFHSGYKDAFNFLLNNNLAQNSILDKVSQNEPIYYNQNKERMHPEANTEQEMKEGEETDTLPSFTDNEHVNGVCAELESPQNQPTKEPNLHFDVMKNVSFYAVLQSRKRMKMFFRQAPESSFWFWHAVRHFSFFFYEIVVCSLKKNVHDRVMPTVLLLQWLKIHASSEASPGQKHASPGQRLPSSAHSEITASLDYKNTSLQ
ncbi:patatin-like phospholipase domain-containing protein 2 [Notolabrus celidotus]|uniref:patatin-like phospholipase domain-containing protein 2 n=1 Tax=Notolabrus celidotus TaxID=1203425 RepID=UPI0014904B8E|nr:patatin-like phospholipase domain-containing protein 2 [Notolabrus celidotus]